MSRRAAVRRLRDDDDGLGLVEAIVAIMLFGLLAVAMVPPMILAIQISASTTTVASAAQVAQGRVELAREASTDCTAFIAFVTTPVPTGITDTRGVEYTLAQTVTAPDGTDAVADVSWCDDDSWAAVTFRVEVTAVDADDPDVADVSTIISVPGIG